MTRGTTGPELPGTLGGAGWVPRAGTHADDVERGELWTACGYRHEWTPLRAVQLARPPASFAAVTDVRDHLMEAPVDLGALRAETEGIAEAFRDEGVRVRFVHPPATCPPNVVFQRDLFFMTPEGAVLARAASAQRAGEERHTAHALSAAGYPILRTVGGAATFEGADALWLDERTVAVGVGFRTNAAGARAVREALRDQGAEVVEVPLARGVQHLLGTVVPLAERFAAVRRDTVTPPLRRLLAERDYDLVEFPDDEDVVRRRGMNLVALGPRRVLVPAGAPSVRRALERSGVDVREVPTTQHVRAAGGLGCVTGVLHRAAPGG
ncbi:dimethylarginine dimethylaminohydrolase family protein [Saccharothrix australiensis]|uniref:N-dimethylarginine dimethylaminohydrolase n=1 Tax=Saccharothrix australiensis TaxID=2072 RepID=A0A495VX49_9PSEU|nr:arginine deiminase family protein [Saccharothrix australiensis]RKT53819.1 N-dimethylarginine dimethylaminohydrolase [Saccharothrix australiensis]